MSTGCNYETAKYRDDRTCRYCGSMHPDDLMSRLEAGTAELDPTDKNYKVYVHNAGGEPLTRAYRKCPPECNAMPDDCLHWVTEETSTLKFYFEHLSNDQMTRFVALYNEKKLKLGYPGFFYRLPFFMRYTEPEKQHPKLDIDGGDHGGNNAPA